jgi:antitoxin VapB
MTRARVFRSGNSQAIRLPREFRLSTDEVDITRQGDLLVMRPLPSNGGALFDALAAIDVDWPEREDGPPEERDGF